MVRRAPRLSAHACPSMLVIWGSVASGENMSEPNSIYSRRRALKLLGAGAVAGAAPASVARCSPAAAQGVPPTPVPLLMDGHVHIINRVYWEKIDPWQPPQGAGWDYGRAFSAGVNCIIDNIGTYGYWNYNYTPKQALRLIETFHRRRGSFRQDGAGPQPRRGPSYYCWRAHGGVSRLRVRLRP